MDVFYEGLVKIRNCASSGERREENTTGRRAQCANPGTKEPKFPITSHPRLSLSSEDATPVSRTFADRAFCGSDLRQTTLDVPRTGKGRTREDLLPF